MQRTAKVPVSRKKQVFKPRRARTIDPRFDPNSTSEYNPVQFSQTYEFLNGMRKNENRQIKQELRKLNKSGQGDSDYANQLRKTMGKNKGDLNISYNNKRIFAAKQKLRQEIRQTGEKINPSKFQFLTILQENIRKS